VPAFQQICSASFRRRTGLNARRRPNDTALRDLIAAAEMTSGDHNVNQDLGDILGKMPHQVSKLKDCLLKKEGVRELYAARKASILLRSSISAATICSTFMAAMIA
jgi:hypothetical protein